jgi:myo-inositol-1(or 4)-monophosphatase
MNTKPINLKKAQAAAVKAARAVGVRLRRNLNATKQADVVTQHDIKLELDVRSQKQIEKALHHAYPDIALLGEEGTAGSGEADRRWVVDPIDGTVNFAYGIPHACISIALQQRTGHSTAPAYEDGFQTLVGVVYDPFCGELWTAMHAGPARLNGRIIHVSRRRKLSEAIISIGFSKTRQDLQAVFPYFADMIHRVRKMRVMGSAALALTYVASGRFDAYIERGIRIWDIAAGGFIVERAGGQFRLQALGDHAYRMIASNGLVHRHLRVP